MFFEGIKQTRSPVLWGGGRNDRVPGLFVKKTVLSHHPVNRRIFVSMLSVINMGIIRGLSGDQ